MAFYGMASSPTAKFRRHLRMEENGSQSGESTDIDQNNNLEEVCIYSIPQYLLKINEAAYTPTLVSIGPLHYSRKELNEMEKHKRTYQSKFRQRKQVSARKWEEMVTYIKEKEQRIRNHYLVSSNLLSSEYVDMILCDAIFIIELFIRYHCKTYDFFLCNSQLVHDLTIDFLLLENQLPYFVLNDLYTKAFGSIRDASFFNLSIKFFDSMGTFNWLFSVQPEVKHFTDLLRHAAVKDLQLQPIKEILDLPNATKLKESGLKFKGIEEKGMLDVDLVERQSCWRWLSWCKVYEVQIPQIKFYDDTECLLRNLMALEAFHYPTQTYICNYVDLMDYLIDTTKDVDLLVEKGVIANCVGNTEAIAKIFNSLCTHITMGPSCYYNIAEKMKSHYKYPLNHIKATLKSVYFCDLWTGTATFAAAFLVMLTLIQTICSIIQVHQGYTKK